MASKHTSLLWRIPKRQQVRSRRYASAAGDQWNTVIGLEIHAQLRTPTKLFSRAPLSYADPPNTHVQAFDAAFPGTLPVLNLDAVRLSILTALALGCTINNRSTFDRKHYFYHDIPSSYQITQHYNPLARDGTVQIQKGENGAARDLTVGIQQLQIEQDTAKSQLVASDRLVDLNRAGTGLMEIVTDPDMRSAEEAGAFVKKLQSLLRRIGSGDGDMDKGNLRVDCNISVHRPGTPFGTRTEIKNLNSVRYLQQAIEYERNRHIEHYNTSSEPLPQETRTLNEITGETIPLRTKEDAVDYRYMPDSNLPAMVIPPAYLEDLRHSVPELPWETVSRIVDTYGVPRSDVETLLNLDEYNALGIQYFEQVAGGDPKLGRRAINWIAHETLGRLYKLNVPWTPTLVPVGFMRDLVQSVEKRLLTGTNAKQALAHVLESHSASAPAAPTSSLTTGPESFAPGTGVKLKDVLSTLGLPTSDSSSSSFDLEAACKRAIENNPGPVKDVKGGKHAAMGRLIGEVMRQAKGGADAQKAREVLLHLIGL